MTRSWKWLKRILWVLLGLLVLLFLAVSTLVYFLNSESYLEDYLKENLGVEAVIGELDVSLLSGTVNISSSIIGPKDDPFIQFDSLKGELDYSRLWSSKLTVELLQLDNAKVRYPFELNLKQTTQESEEASLPFDFIDVAAIDVNNLSFEYRGEVSLLAKGASVKVRNIPVAEDGFLLFGDLDRLVKASQTTLEAKLDTLQSNKSQLNNLTLNAHIEKQRLIIDDITSGKSTITIDLLQQPTSSAKASPTVVAAEKVAHASNTEKTLEFPFDDVVINRVDLGETDLSIQDKEEISIKGIEAEFTELLLVQDKKALWLDWTAFYKAQDSSIKLKSEAMKSDFLDFATLSLEGELKQGNFTVPELNFKQPTLKLSLNDVETVSDEVTPEKTAESSSWYLPFKSATLQKALISQGAIKVTTNNEQHSVSDIGLELSQIPLVVEHQLIFINDKLSSDTKAATISLKDAAYTGAFGEIKKISSQLSLSDSKLAIKDLTIEQPSIAYDIRESARGESSKSTTSQAVLPMSEITLEKLAIINGDASVKFDGKSYAGSGLDFELTQIPLYAQNNWVVTQPNNWKTKSSARLSLKTVNIPQGSLTAVNTSADFDNNKLDISELKLGGADLSIDVSDTGQKASSNTSEQLPLEYVQLNAITLNNISLKYQNDDIEYQVNKGNLALDRYPLIRDSALVSQPLDYMSKGTNQVSLNISRLKIPEGTIDGLELKGVLRDKDLLLDYLKNQSANLTFKNAVESEAIEEAADKTSREAEKPLKSEGGHDFALRTIKIGDIKFQRVNAELIQVNGEESNTTTVKNLYLGATEIMLAKNHQTIDQWYGSQLENAFTLIALRVENIAQQHNDISDLTITAVQNNQVINVQPLRMTVNEAPFSANWTIDLSKQPYQSTYISEFSNLSLGKLIEPANKDSIGMSGELQGEIAVKFEGLDSKTFLSSLNGDIFIRNQSLVTIRHLNINKVIKSFLDSQEFGLLDIGGFLLAGPLGLLASQGVSLQDTIGQLGADKGDTQIPHMNIDMNIKDGLLMTKDVAVATDKYRFAFNGEVILDKQEFKDLDFDIINKKGCREYGQTLNGSITSPKIETFTAAFDAVTGSVVGLFKQGVGLITGGACSSVYEGVVPHPEKGAEIIPQDKRRVIDPNAKEGESEGDRESSDGNTSPKE
ncbi:hypothetical protein GCM10009123_22300 [Kangiella japonica]|uniref:AsmA-like C-terminal domain-containing protein n=1 Tax=Kangiella japonica TaxID=647384 RepID=A0ABN0T7R4_9GAMM